MTTLRRASLLLLPLLAVCARAQVDPPPAPEPAATPPATPPPAGAPSMHAAFDRLLREHVADGLVDYAAIRDGDRDVLRSYLDRLAEVDPADLGRDARFAFYVNLYNAAMIEAVLDHTAKRPQWTPAADDFAVFKEPRVRLAKGKVTLDHLENEILRPRFEDARVHVALVCGARSCPPLLPRAYEAADLDRVLDANMKAFLHDPARNRIDHETRTARLSRIFEWFAADFGGEAGVRALLARHHGDAVARYRITYLDYSWELNRQPPKKR